MNYAKNLPFEHHENAYAIAESLGKEVGQSNQMDQDPCFASNWQLKHAKTHVQNYESQKTVKPQYNLK